MTTEEGKAPTCGFTPAQTTYANTLKREAGQTGTESNGGETPQAGHKNPNPTFVVPEPDPGGGFTPSNIFDNLDPIVRRTLEQAKEAILIHYLDGGYNPNIAQNVHVMTESLQRLYANKLEGREDLESTVIHPPVAELRVHNACGASFIFLVTEIPEEFREWFVERAIHPVTTSHLGFLSVDRVGSESSLQKDGTVALLLDATTSKRTTASTLRAS